MTSTKAITISGNFRSEHTREWAGDGTVDEDGNIDCSADIDESVYHEIESQIRSGQTEGSVTAANDVDWPVEYRWEFR